MDYTRDDFDRILRSLDTLSGRFGGRLDSDDKKLTGKEKFDKAITKSADALQILHGSAFHASSALRQLLGGGALAGAVMLAIESIKGMSTAFTKLSDVGQSFTGSMFEMSRQAGEFGLSL